MAKKSKATDVINVAVRIDLDDYAKTLLKLRGQTEADGKKLESQFKKIGDEIAKKWFSAQAAIRIAESAVKSFTRTADELEKEGRGNEGTAAMSRLENAASRVWESFVRGVLNMNSVQVAMDRITDTIASIGKAMPVVLNAIETVQQMGEAITGDVKILLSDVLDLTGDFVVKIGRALKALGADQVGLSVMQGGQALGRQADAMLMKAVDQRNEALRQLKRLDEERNISTMIGDASKFGVPMKSVGFSVNKQLLADEVAKLKKLQSGDAPASGRGFLDDMTGVVSGFQNSWITGLDHVAQKMREFSEETQRNIFGMAKGVGQGMGDLVDSISLSAQMAIKVFGQSSDAARIFEAVQLAVTGSVAAVKSVFAIAKANELMGDKDNAGALLEIAASAGYASAAALSGVAAAQALSAPRGVGSDIGSSPVLGSGSIGRERRTVIVNIQNAVGGRQFTEDVVIPEINRAAGRDVTIKATYATSAGRVDPAAA